ncbi:hypothetical protein D3C71_1550640 [compost metagenome]
MEARQMPIQHARGQHQRCRGDPVHGAPIAQRGQRPGYGARQQDAEQQAAHYRTDNLAALFRPRQRRRERHQHLCHHREQPGQRGAHQQPDELMAQRAQYQPCRRQQRHDHDQPAPFEQIAQRHQQDQARRIAQLGHGHHRPGTREGHPELPGDGVQQRLRVIVAGHGNPGGEGHQQDLPAAEWRGHVVGHDGLQERRGASVRPIGK